MKIAKRFTRSFHYGQKGFTLVELLIVIAILGILAAVAIPNLVSFIGTGDDAAEATELDVVQTAMIAVLAANNITSVVAVAVGSEEGDLAAFPRGTGDVDLSTLGDFDDFLVNPDVAYWYSWTVDGVVSQVDTAPAP